jgi:hypothetical protein
MTSWRVAGHVLQIRTNPVLIATSALGSIVVVAPERA